MSSCSFHLSSYSCRTVICSFHPSSYSCKTVICSFHLSSYSCRTVICSFHLSSYSCRTVIRSLNLPSYTYSTICCPYNLLFINKFLNRIHKRLLHPVEHDYPNNEHNCHKTKAITEVHPPEIVHSYSCKPHSKGFNQRSYRVCQKKQSFFTQHY